PAGACARGLSAWYQARAPITPRAALSRWHGRTSARERPRGSRRRRGEPCMRAQPRGKASARRAGLQSGRVWGGCVHAGGGVADEVLRGILRAGCDRLGSRQPGGCGILAAEARRSGRCPSADPLTLAASGSEWALLPSTPGMSRGRCHWQSPSNPAQMAASFTSARRWQQMDDTSRLDPLVDSWIERPCCGNPIPLQCNLSTVPSATIFHQVIHSSGEKAIRLDLCAGPGSFTHAGIWCQLSMENGLCNLTKLVKGFPGPQTELPTNAAACLPACV
ncbi:hypothetical protein U0070_023804, partial [Myodes glareolus]